MANINLVATNIDEIKQSIINKFSQDPNSPFKDYFYEGSALNYLIDILVYSTFYNNYYSAVNINELYLPYAQKEKNIYALSKSLGYSKRRPSGAIAYIRPTLPTLYRADTTKDVVIPIYSSLKSQKGLHYILMEEIRFRYDAGSGTWKTVRNNIFETDDGYYYKIKQGQFKALSFTPTLQPLQKITINAKNIDNSKDSIIVQDTVTHEYWSPCTDISDFDLDTSLKTILEANTTIAELKNELVINNMWDNYILNMNESPMFFIDENTTQTILTFGDGVIGKIPTNLMDVFYVLTEGSNGNGETSFYFVGSTTYTKNDGSSGTINNKNIIVEIRENTSSVGGADAETVESMRKLAPSFFNTQNRDVTDRDYETFLIQQNSVQLQNIKCIGGEKLKPITMGAVGICANKASPNNDVIQSLLTDEEKELLKLILKNQNVVTINPIFINPEFVKVNINSNIYYNPLKNDDSFIYMTTNTIIDTYFQSIVGFNKYFKSSNLITILDMRDEIDHNLLYSDLEYIKVLNKKDIKTDIYINLGENNPIKRGSLSKTVSNDYFLKIFNEDLLYEWTEYDPETETGVFIKPDGSSNWDFNDYKENETYSKIHKIFLYDLEEVETSDENIGQLVLVEKMPHQLKATRIDGSNDYPFYFEYENIQETGKRKIIGEIHYNIGLIKLFLDDVSFKYKDDNKKSRKLALETQKTETTVVTKIRTEKKTTYVDIDNDDYAFETYSDLFFYEYEFDSISNLPWLNIQTRTPSSNYVFTFAFNTEDTDFESMGNVIIEKGNVVINRYPEVNKK